MKFTTEHAQIAVGVQRMGDTVALSVTDDGAGLAPELLERVFDVFVQGAQGIGRAKGGIGVGLSLVRRLVELHGGTVDVASDGAGRGAVFTVRLPAVDAPACTAAPTLAGPRDPRPCRVLLVEDNTDAREMLKQVLEMEGHDVVEAADGLSGVAAGDAHDIDVAVVDIGLPDIDGHEVARRLRQGRSGRATLIALTGYGQPEDRERALAAGFDIHLVKPATLERLNEAIALAAAPRAG